MAEKDARPLDYLDALPTDGGKVRPPMPDDGTLYEWDEDFGWIEAMTDEGERIEAGDTVIQLVEQEGKWVPHFYDADGDKVRPPMPDDSTPYEWDEDFGWIEAPPT